MSKKKIFGLTIVLVAMFIGLFSLNAESKSQFIYVDDSASGSEDGSSNHPYSKIQKGVDKAKSRGKDVYVRKGEYKENIELWDGVEIHGSDKNDVKIKADDDSEEVVKMYNNTKLFNVTVKKGKYGIKVNDGDEVYIQDCIIVDNDDDGIKIEPAKTHNDKKVEVRNSVIAHNGWNGIYSEARKFVIKNNEIYDNNGDGVEFEKGSEGVFEDNLVKDNDGVGLKVTIDGSEIYIKDNTFRDNDKSGLEVDAEGREGYVSVNWKNKFYKNDRFGIVRVMKAPFGDDQWFRSLKIEDGIIYWDNAWGTIPNVFKVF